MKLSIVIVNYNVRHFLEKCLESVYQSETNFDFEVYVVDNHSVDGSVEMVARQFQKAHLLANKENLGFAKANNQAIRQSSGEYALLLNPDTIVKEDTFQKVVDFMDTHADAGALGVKMMDGKGHFLPESKRGFPSPKVAFWKMSGLSSVFKNSKTFNYYHQGHLDKNKTHEVDVLSGAFMLLRATALEQTGLLDEDYFMYGEDIDLSYRIKQAGYKNYYFADTDIIHFKGESTKKGSFNYVKMFYNAMIIFTKKHLSGSSAKNLTGLLQAAIYVRATASMLRRGLERIAWPLLDVLMIFGALFGIKLLWENVVKEGVIYPTSYLLINVPLYIGLWLLAYFFKGGYDKPIRLGHIPTGIGIGTVMILAIYALLPEDLRSSRGMILSGAVAAVCLMTASRFIYYTLKNDLDTLFHRHKRLLVAAEAVEYKRIQSLVEQADLHHELVGWAGSRADNGTGNYLGPVTDIPEIADVLNIDEIIFSVKDVSHRDIMEVMSKVGSRVEYKLISEGSDVILGSHSKHTPGELYTMELNFRLNQPGYRRVKRLTDIMGALIRLVLFPILIWFVADKAGYFPNTFQVLFGRKTWVGYAGTDVEGLPQLKPGVRAVVDDGASEIVKRKANVSYAKDYDWLGDLGRLFL